MCLFIVKTGAKIRNISNLNNDYIPKLSIYLQQNRNVKINGLSVIFVF